LPKIVPSACTNADQAAHMSSGLGGFGAFVGGAATALLAPTDQERASNVTTTQRIMLGILIYHSLYFNASA
jgi:hypothetical protein